MHATRAMPELIRANAGSGAGSWLARLGVAIIAASGWLITVPLVALALVGDGFGWAPVVFIPIAVLTALAWWFHLRERDERIGAAGTTAGWAFIGSVALLGVAAFFWILVAAAVLVSAAAYGIVLVATQRLAQRPRFELATGLSLIAAGAVPAAFTLLVGIGDTEAWWMTSHVLLAVGISLATVLSAVRQAQPAQPQPLDVLTP